MEVRRSPQPGAATARRRPGIRWWVLLLFAGYAIFYWFTHQEESSFTGRQRLIDTSEQQEAALGFQAYDQILDQSRVIASGPVVDTVKEISGRLVQAAPQLENQLAERKEVAERTDWNAFDWEVSVIDSEQANAFCLPGGKMAVYTGILPIAQNEDALAAIMGHEIAHALLRHGGERMAHQKLVQIGALATGVAVGELPPEQQRAILGALGVGATIGFLNPYSRDHESEADYVGLMLAASACYDPREAVGLWQRMSQAGGSQPPEFMSTHPGHETRINQLQQWMPEALQTYQANCGSAPAGAEPMPPATY